MTFKPEDAARACSDAVLDAYMMLKKQARCVR